MVLMRRNKIRNPNLRINHNNPNLNPNNNLSNYYKNHTSLLTKVLNYRDNKTNHHHQHSISSSKTASPHLFTAAKYPNHKMENKNQPYKKSKK